MSPRHGQLTYLGLGLFVTNILLRYERNGTVAMRNVQQGWCEGPATYLWVCRSLSKQPRWKRGYIAKPRVAVPRTATRGIAMPTTQPRQGLHKQRCRNGLWNPSRVIGYVYPVTTPEAWYIGILHKTHFYVAGPGVNSEMAESLYKESIQPSAISPAAAGLEAKGLCESGRLPCG